MVPLDCFSFPLPSHALYGPCDPTHPFTQRICSHEASYGSIHGFHEPGSIAERFVCISFFTLSIGCGRRFFHHVGRRSISFHLLGLGFVVQTIQSFQRVLVRASSFFHDVVMCIPNPCNQSPVLRTPQPDQSHVACIEWWPDPIVAYEGREAQIHPIGHILFITQIPSRGQKVIRCHSRSTQGIASAVPWSDTRWLGVALFVSVALHLKMPCIPVAFASFLVRCVTRTPTSHDQRDVCGMIRCTLWMNDRRKSASSLFVQMGTVLGIRPRASTPFHLSSLEKRFLPIVYHSVGIHSNYTINRHSTHYVDTSHECVMGRNDVHR